ncbi:MAG: CehA/McbA family metallohydrolase [Armatimonadota bacterium]|nr:CehA/McbA family metallohydrolase [Armatimonadota bacterium]MCX7777173.1 CehA/McbA family metallohydrolase [Armatimonadota bacterium]MDW8025000.1 CehA/McbA family metallohydrolase [Armatimonadota bacterium]
MRIEFPNPFASDGVWFKGNLHTHTKRSDGALEPHEVVKRYAEAGYDFLAITDHNKLTLIDEKESCEMLLIPGEEISVGVSEVGTEFHFVAIGIERQWEKPEGMLTKEISPSRLVKEIHSLGGVAILCHPYWSQLTVHDMLSFDGYIAIEIFNTSCHHSIGKGFSTTHWDDLLFRGRFVWGVAVDDAHYHFNEHRPVDICGAWVMVKCRQLTMKDVLEALQHGLFYSSTGPHFMNVHFEGEWVHVETSSVKTITFVSDNGKGERWTAVGKDEITEAHYKLRGGERFLRIECADREGNCAWTNPMRIIAE